MSTRVLLFVRHGDYHQGEEEEANKKLTELGQRQANNASIAIKKVPELPRITKLISSTLIRAIETAEIIRQNIPGIQYRQDSTLVEGNISSEEDRERFERVYTTYCKAVQGKHSQAEVIVAHENLIRYIVFR